MPSVPLNTRTADADRGSLAKGGEEKSPYCSNFIIRDLNVLDAKPTIALRLLDNLQGCKCTAQK